MDPLRMVILLSALAAMLNVSDADDDGVIKIKKRKKTSNGQGGQTKRRVEAPGECSL